MLKIAVLGKIANAILPGLAKARNAIVSFLKKIGWKGWLVIILVAALIIGVWQFQQWRIRTAEKERELLRELANAQSQVELGEGVIYANATKIDNLYRQLGNLHVENSTLAEKIDRRIEEPVISIQTEVRYRDRIVYVYEPNGEGNDPEDTASSTVETTTDEEGNIIEENAIVNFDLRRRPFRVFGRTESVGPRIQLEIEQVEPFTLGVVVTRERRSGEWNLLIEDTSEMLDISVGHFVVDDRSLTRTRFVDRLGVGSTLNVGGNSSTVGVHGSVDLGQRTSIWLGPSWNISYTDENEQNVVAPGNFGVGVGFTFRPFIRNQR